MGLSHMDGPVAGILHQAGKQVIRPPESLPVPVVGAVVVAVIGLAADPVGGPVAGRILAGKERTAGRGTHALRVKLREADSLLRQAFHIGRAVPVVEGEALWNAKRIGEEGDRRVHGTHVVHDKENDVRPLLGLCKRSCGKACKGV